MESLRLEKFKKKDDWLLSNSDKKKIRGGFLGGYGETTSEPTGCRQVGKDRYDCWDVKYD